MQAALRCPAQHIAGALVAAKDIEKAADAQTLLTRVQDLLAEAIYILESAKTAGKLETALGAIRELFAPEYRRPTLIDREEAIARLTPRGEIGPN